MRLDSIVVGMDFSEAAIKSAKWVSQQLAPNAAVTLAHIIDLPDHPRFASHVGPERADVEAAAREYAATEMRHLQAFLADTAPRIEIRVGKPYEEIVKIASEQAADLIVVGPHGNRPRHSAFLGTTADRVVRTSPIPVLVAANPPAGPPRNILVPVDDDAVTSALLSSASDLAKAFDSDVTLLHVWSNAAYSHVASMAHATASSESEAQSAIDNDLREAALHWLRELGRTGIDRERVSALVTYGSPGEAVVEVAAARHVDLIMMGKHGSGLVGPALLGSTISSVLHEVKCPVLVLEAT